MTNFEVIRLARKLVKAAGKKATLLEHVKDMEDELADARAVKSTMGEHLAGTERQTATLKTQLGDG